MAAIKKEECVPYKKGDETSMSRGLGRPQGEVHIVNDVIPDASGEMRCQPPEHSAHQEL